MSKENLFKLKVQIAGRMADIAMQHFSADAVDDELIREATLLSMAHAVLAKEWEQRLLPWKMENIREHVKEAWNRWNEMGFDHCNTWQESRVAAMEDFRRLIDLIDEG